MKVISFLLVLLGIILPYVEPFYTISQSNTDHYTALLRYLEVKVRSNGHLSFNRFRADSLRLFDSYKRSVSSAEIAKSNLKDQLSSSSTDNSMFESEDSDLNQKPTLTTSSTSIEEYLDVTDDDEYDNSNDEDNDDSENGSLSREDSAIITSSLRSQSKSAAKLASNKRKMRISTTYNSAHSLVGQRLLSKIRTNFYEGTMMLDLQYDYLEPNALNAIQLLPFVKREKGKLFQTKWWSAAVKWGLLTGDILQYHQAYLQSLPTATSTATAGTTTTVVGKSSIITASPPPYELIEKLSHEHRARVIAIGDVHGCIDELLTLLRKVELLPGDLILFLGDMVAKGPFSELVIELAMDIGAVSVRGNHDYEIIRQYLKEHSATAAKSPEQSVSGNNGPHAKIARCLDPEEMEWISSLPYMIQSQDLGAIFVHAGFLPSKSLKLQSTKTMMTVRSLVDGEAVRRCVLNAPWAAEWKGPLTVYYGHDATRGFQRYPHAVCTDSGCVNGGQLTAVLFPEENIVSVPAKKVYLKQKRMVQFK